MKLNKTHFCTDPTDPWFSPFVQDRYGDETLPLPRYLLRRTGLLDMVEENQMREPR